MKFGRRDSIGEGLLDQLHKGCLQLSAMKSAKDVLLTLNEILRTLVQCKHCFIIISDPDLRNLLKEEKSKLYNFMGLNGKDNLDVLLDGSERSTEEIK